MAPPQHDIAVQHFKCRILSRRTRDNTTHDSRRNEVSGERRVKYRRVDSTEHDDYIKIEEYPLFHFDINQYAHFGLGTGIYFLQIVLLCSYTFAAGVILAPNMYAYGAENKNLTSPFLKYSAACSSSIQVQLFNSAQTAEFRDCPLPRYIAILDIIMCLFLTITMFVSKYIENALAKKLDVAVQSAQDYGVVVDDPDEDAEDPDEWYHYFSKFGTVKYVTVVRRNRVVCSLLLQRHLLLRKVSDQLAGKDQIISLLEKSRQVAVGKKSCFSCASYTVEEKVLMSIQKIDAALEAVYREKYSVQKVYVIFELEKEQRFCLKSLSIPLISASEDSQFASSFVVSTSEISDVKFRGHNSLYVCEPSEPDNIHWQDLEYSPAQRNFGLLISFLISAGCLAASFILTIYIKVRYPEYLFIVVALIDTALPTIFSFLQKYIEIHYDEDDKQDSLLVRLFFARLLSPIIAPFAFTSWNEFINPQNINSILSVQLSTCFTSVAIQLLDLNGIFSRHILAPLLSKSQAEYNGYWSGSSWTLAERYTQVGKIIFISLLYSIFTPCALFIAAGGFLFLFLADNFMLFRRWAPMPMLDPSMANRVRQCGLLAISVHMYVASRWVYSWPMDEVWYDQSVAGYVEVDKQAPYSILALSVEPWHSDSQASAILFYKVATILIFIFTGFVLFGESFLDFIREMCFKGGQKDNVGDVVSIPYTKIERITTYCPTVSYGTEKFLCSDIRNMQYKHRPTTFANDPEENPDISLQVPEHKRSHVLSIVKYYPSVQEMEARTEGEKTKVENTTSEKPKENLQVQPRSQISFIQRKEEESREDRLLRKCREHIAREVELETKRLSLLQSTEKMPSDEKHGSKNEDYRGEDTKYLEAAGRGAAHRAKMVAENQRKFRMPDGTSEAQNEFSSAKEIEPSKLSSKPSEKKVEPVIERILIPFKRPVIEPAPPKKENPVPLAESKSRSDEDIDDGGLQLWSSFETVLLHELKQAAFMAQTISGDSKMSGTKIVRSYAQRLKDDDVIDFDIFCRIIETDCDISRASSSRENPSSSSLVRKNLRRLFAKISDNVKSSSTSFDHRGPYFLGDMRWESLCRWLTKFEIPVAKRNSPY